MALPKQTLRIVVAQNTYRLASRLKHLLVLGDYQRDNIFEAIEASELLALLGEASPVHVVILTPTVVSELERNGLSQVLQNEFGDVAIVCVDESAAQEHRRTMEIMPDYILIPPITAESFDEAVAAALQRRANRKLAAEHIAQGEIALREDRSQEAQTSFESAVSLCGQDPYASYALGKLFMDAGHTEQAIMYFTQAWERDPLFYAAIHRIVELLLAWGKNDQAIPYLERVARQESAPVECLVCLGTLYLETGTVEAANAVLQRACRVDPSRTIAETQARVRSLIERDASESAIALLRIVIEAQPENARLHSALGDLYMKQNRPREAVSCYETVIRFSNPQAALYCQLARAYMALGFALRAEKAIRLALELDAKCEEALSLRVAVLA